MVQNSKENIDIHVLEFLFDWTKMQKHSEREINFIDNSSAGSLKPRVIIIKTEILRLFLETAITINTNVTNEERIMSVKGMTFIIEGNESGEDIIRMIASVCERIANCSCHVLAIYVIYKILKNIDFRKLQPNAKPSANNSTPFHEIAIFKTIHSYLKTSHEEMGKWANKNLYIYMFKVIDLWLKIKGDKICGGGDFNSIICFSYNSGCVSLQKATKAFFIENFNNIDNKESVFPKLFDLSETDDPKIEQPSAELNSLFTELFILTNIKQGHIKMQYLNSVTGAFELVSNIAKLVGENELWKIISLTTVPDELQKLSMFVNQIYKSCKLSSSNKVLDDMASNFTTKFIAVLDKVLLDDNYSAIKSVLSVGIFVINNLTGIKTRPSISSSQKVSLKMYLKKLKRHMSVETNTTFLGLIDHAKVIFGTKKNLSIFIDSVNIANLNLLEQSTVEEFEKINFEERKLVFKPVNRFVDLSYYKDQVCRQISQNKGFYYVMDKLIRIDNSDISLQTDSLIANFPPHKEYIQYFVNRLGKKRLKLQEIMFYDNMNLFSRYSNIILSILSRGPDKDAKKVINLIKNERIYDFFSVIVNLKSDDRDEPFKVRSQILILKIILQVLDSNYRVKPKKINLESVFEALVGILEILNASQVYKDSHLEYIRVISQSLLLLNCIKAVLLNTIIKTLQLRFDSMSVISNTFIFAFCEAINSEKNNKLSWTELRTLITDASKGTIPSEYALVYLSLIVKMYDEKKLVQENCDGCLKVFLKTCLSLKRMTVDPRNLILTMKLVYNILTKYRNITFDINDEMVSWLDFYVFRSDQTKDNYSNYFYLVGDSDQLKHALDLVFAALSRKDLNSIQIMQLLQNFIRYQKYRGSSEHDWNIAEQLQALETNKEFRGLLNLGSTCYFNSCLQQLFMIDEFAAFFTKLRIQDTSSLLSKVS